MCRKKRMVIISVPGMVLLFFLGVSGETYYVSTEGEASNAGTFENPFATISAFHEVAGPGDTCFVRGGQYVPSSTILLTKDGSEGRPICLFAYPGETPVLDGRNADDEACLKLRNTDWWHIKGIEVTNTTGEWTAGIRVNGISSHITFEECVTHHCRFVGLMISGDASDILMLNCDSHHNVDSDYEDADGFQVYPGNHARIVYRGCRAWNNADDGWDFYFASAGSAVMENCWAFKNGYDDNGDELGNGNGFKLGGSTSDERVTESGGHTLIRCLAWGNKYCGFNENTDIGGTPDTLYHCTGYMNGGWTDYDFDTGLEHVLINNLTYRTNGAAVGNSDARYNSWDLSIQIEDGDIVSLDDNGLDGPRRDDGGLPETDFLKPAETSSFIDQGLDIGFVFSGSSPDLGAFEYEDQTLIQSYAASDRSSLCLNCPKLVLNSQVIFTGGYNRQFHKINGQHYISLLR